VEAEEALLGDAVRVAGTALKEYTYPGSGHLFADPDLPTHDRASSEAMWRRVLAFLDRRLRDGRQGDPVARTPVGRLVQKG
jgi:dienelactone hydrolase